MKPKNAGNRLSCRTDFLISLLADKKSQLVLLITAQKYLEKQREEGSGTFRTETLLALISSKRIVKFVRRIPKRARAAVENLSQYDRSTFESRLVAIGKALAQSIR
jgi:hypothetical protein